MKNKKILLLLPLMPLLMANSPARSNYSIVYKDFQATYIGEQIEDNYRYQKFHLNNSGDGFIETFYVNGKDSYDFYAYFYTGDFFPIFEQTLIGPHQEVDLKIKSNTPLVNVDGSKLEYRVNAYTTYTKDIAVSGSKKVELIKEELNYCYYKIDIKVDSSEQKNSHSLVVKANYDGQELYLKINTYDNYRFYTSELLDLSKLEIDGVVACLQSNSDSDYDGLAVISAFFARLFIVFLVILFIVANIIFLTVFLPKIIRKSKQRKRDLEKQKKNEGE